MLLHCGEEYCKFLSSESTQNQKTRCATVLLKHIVSLRNNEITNFIL